MCVCVCVAVLRLPIVNACRLPPLIYCTPYSVLFFPLSFFLSYGKSMKISSSGKKEEDDFHIKTIPVLNLLLLLLLYIIFLIIFLIILIIDNNLIIILIVISILLVFYYYFIIIIIIIIITTKFIFISKIPIIINIANTNTILHTETTPYILTNPEYFSDL